MILIVCNCKSSENALSALVYSHWIPSHLFLYSLFVSSGQYTHRPQILSPLLKECPNLAMARGRSSFVNVYLYIRQIIYIQRTKSIPFSEILCMIFATCISGVQNDRFVGQRMLMFCNVLGLSSKFIFLILLLNTIQNGLCIKIFLFFLQFGLRYHLPKKKKK